MRTERARRRDPSRRQRRSDVPNYGTAIDRLADIGVLTTAFAGRFRDVAGFRNVIVHGYLDVDPEIVHQVLNERLHDFGEFAGAVSRYLDEQAGR